MQNKFKLRDIVYHSVQGEGIIIEVDEKSLLKVPYRVMFKFGKFWCKEEDLTSEAEEKAGKIGLYLLNRNGNTEFDMFDSIMVAAKNTDTVLQDIENHVMADNSQSSMIYKSFKNEWTIEYVGVYVGNTDKTKFPFTMIQSFNAA